MALRATGAHMLVVLQPSLMVAVGGQMGTCQDSLIAAARGVLAYRLVNTPTAHAFSLSLPFSSSTDHVEAVDVVSQTISPSARLLATQGVLTPKRPARYRRSGCTHSSCAQEQLSFSADAFTCCHTHPLVLTSSAHCSTPCVSVATSLKEMSWSCR